MPCRAICEVKTYHETWRMVRPLIMPYKNDYLERERGEGGLKTYQCHNFLIRKTFICGPNATNRPLMDSFIMAMEVKEMADILYCILKVLMTFHPIE